MQKRLAFKKTFFLFRDKGFHQQRKSQQNMKVKEKKKGDTTRRYAIFSVKCVYFEFQKNLNVLEIVYPNILMYSKERKTKSLNI